MDFLWTPWRYSYLTREPREGECIFCATLAGDDDRESLLLHRGRHAFVMLNRYPYSSGHLMIVPNVHVATLSDCPREALIEITMLSQRAEANLVNVYNCPGLNMGYNLGACAGAGIAGHIHLHVVPRWVGDANFMTVLGETRVLPEELATTYSRLKDLWD